MPREPLLPVAYLPAQCDGMARDEDSRTLAALRSATFDARGRLLPSTESAGNPQTIHSGICHGTLGELFQGPYIRDDELHISLISLPIKKYSFVHFAYGKSGHIDADLTHKKKSRQAIDIYLSLHQIRLPSGRWTYDSELMQGKGMASSTADIVATIRCLDAIFKRKSSIKSISKILREVERSDSVFLDTYALYLSGQQEVIHSFGFDPKFYVCYIDEGDAIDTEKAGAPLLAYYERNLSAYLTNLNRAVNGFLECNLLEIARCATASATLAQGVIPKRNLDIMLSRQSRYKADGIVVAHTGSLLGYLYIQKPSHMEMGELSSFFHGLGYQCRFVQTAF